MEQTDTTIAEQRRTAAAGKNLTFTLASEQYGIPILKVREIIGMLEVTPVPQTPMWTRGVINLRGKIIPVVDLRVRLDMMPAERTPETCIIVVQVRDVEMGMIVDTVSEVTNIPLDALSEPPKMGLGIRTDYLLAVGRVNGEVQLIIDIDHVLSDGEIDDLMMLG